jgi:hypothetical protein
MTAEKNHDSAKQGMSGRGRDASSSSSSTSIRAYCSQCRHQHTFVRARHHHRLHFFLTVATLGIWLVPWIAVCIGQVLRPWRCEHCGWHKPVFRDPNGRFRHQELSAEEPGTDGSVGDGAELQRSRTHA